MSESLRRIAVIGGSRIPFCRSNSMYAEKTNLDMLSAALQGLTDRFDCSVGGPARAKERVSTMVQRLTVPG